MPQNKVQIIFEVEGRKAEQATKEIGNALDKMGVRAKVSGEKSKNALDRMSAASQRTAQKIEATRSGFERFGQGITNFVQSPIQNAQLALQRFTQKLGPVGVGLAAVGAAAAVALRQIIRIGNAYNAQINDLLNLSQGLGLSAENTLLLEVASKRAGTTLNEMSIGIRRIVEALQGTGPEAETTRKKLEELGVIGGSVDETLFNLADKLASIQDRTKRAAVGADILGRSYGRLVTALVDVSTNGDDLRKTLDDLGLTITDEVVKANAEWQNSTTTLELRVRALQARLAGVATVITNFVANNIDAIAAIGSVATALVVAIGLWKSYSAIVALATAATTAFNLSTGGLLLIVGAIAAAIGGGTFAYLKYKESIDATNEAQKEFNDSLNESVGVVNQDVALSRKAREAKIAETKARIAATKAAIEENKARVAGLPPQLQIPPLRKIEIQEKALGKLQENLTILTNIKETTEVIGKTDVAKNRLTEQQKELLMEIANLKAQEVAISGEINRTEGDKLPLIEKRQQLKRKELDLQIQLAANEDQQFRLSLQRVGLEAQFDEERRQAVQQRLKLEEAEEKKRTREAERIAQDEKNRKASLERQLKAIEIFAMKQDEIGLSEVDAANLQYKRDVVNFLAREEEKALGLAKSEEEREKIRRTFEEARESAEKAQAKKIEEITKRQNEELARLEQERFDNQVIFLGMTRDEIKRTFEDAVVRARNFGDFWKAFWADLLNNLKRQFAEQLANILFGSRPSRAGSPGQAAGSSTAGGILGGILGGIFGGLGQAPGPGGTAATFPSGPSTIPGAASTLPDPSAGRRVLGPKLEDILDIEREIDDKIDFVGIERRLDGFRRAVCDKLDRMTAILEAILERLGNIASSTGSALVGKLLGGLPGLGGLFGLGLPDPLILKGFPGTAGIPMGTGMPPGRTGGLRIPGLDRLLRGLFPSGFNLGGLFGGLLGGALGRGSRPGSILGGLGGSILGALGVGGFVSGGLAGIGAAFLTNPFTAIIGGALLGLGGLFGAFGRRGKEKRIASASVEEMFSKINELIAEVKTDQIDGPAAIQNANKLWSEWVQFLERKLKDKKVIRRSKESQRIFFDEKLSELEKERRRQERRRLNRLLIPEFARGGQIGSRQLALLEPGELYFPPELTRAIGIDTLNRLNSNDVFMPDKLDVLTQALASGGSSPALVPGRSRGIDEVPSILRPGGFVLRKKAVDSLLGPMPLRSTDRSNPQAVAAINKFLNIQRLQGGGGIGFGGLPPELIALLLFFLQGGLSPEELQVLMQLLEGFGAGGGIPDALKDLLIAQLQPLLDRLPTDQRQRVIEAIKSATTFSELQASLQQLVASPDFILSLLDPILGRLPEGPLRDIFGGALGALVPGLLAGTPIRELVRSPEFLQALLSGALGGLNINPALKGVLELLLPALITRRPIRDVLSDPALVEPVVNDLLPSLLGRFPGFGGLPEDQQGQLLEALGLPVTGLVTGVAGGNLDPATIQQLSLLLTPILPGRLQPFGLLAGFFAPEIANLVARRRGGEPMAQPGFLQRIIPLLPLLAALGGEGTPADTIGAILAANELMKGGTGGLGPLPGARPSFLLGSLDIGGLGGFTGGGVGGGIFSNFTPNFFTTGGGAPALSTTPSAPSIAAARGGQRSGRRETNNFFLIIGDAELQAIADKTSLTTARQVKAILLRGF